MNVPTCRLVDAALRRIGKTRHGGHIDRSQVRLYLPQNCKYLRELSSDLKNGFHQWIQRIFLVVVGAKKFFSRKIFFCFQNLDALYRPVAGKPFVLEDLSWAWALLRHLP